MIIKITRLPNNLLHITPAPTYVEKYLMYSRRSFEMRKYKMQNRFERISLHRTDGKGGVYTFGGFFHTVCEIIEKNQDRVKIVNKIPQMPEVDWERIKRIGARPSQVGPLVNIMLSEDGVGLVHAAMGFGKTYMQALIYAGWNKLNTILAVPSKQIFLQAAKKFEELFPEKHIGRMGGGFRDLSPHITVCTFASLKNCALEKCQLLLVDEVQACTGDAFQSTVKEVSPLRTFGFTATDKGTFSQSDKVIKGLFGSRLVHVPYSEAESQGDVVPIIVYMVKMPVEEDLTMMSGDISNFLRSGIRRNKVRNKLIGNIVKAIPDGWQSITFINQVSDHLPDLWKHMPTEKTKFLHRTTQIKAKARKKFELPVKEQDAVVEAFSNGEFQHLLATDAFRAGVDMPQCRVIVQASGGSSLIEITQEAGRVSRTLKLERMEELGITEPKTHGVVVDVYDRHHPWLREQSEKRMEIYREQQWDVRVVNSIEDIDWREQPIKNE